MPEALGIWAFLLVSFALFIPHSMDLTNVASYRKKKWQDEFLNNDSRGDKYYYFEISVEVQRDYN